MTALAEMTKRQTREAERIVTVEQLLGLSDEGEDLGIEIDGCLEARRRAIARVPLEIVARHNGAGLDDKPATIGFDKRCAGIDHPVDPQVGGEDCVLYFVPAEQDTVIGIGEDRIGRRRGEIA